MNHCIDCGRRVNTGGRASFTNHKRVRCLICQTARTMATFRYVSPAARRWRMKKDAAATRREQREIEELCNTTSSH